MIGYYVHHQGSGHRNRALTVNRAYAGSMTGLSTLPRPDAWVGDWIVLPDDAVAPSSGLPGPDAIDPDAIDPDVTANGRLHYVPIGGSGLSERMAVISQWLQGSRPDAVVVDVSVEVAVLARLHGVPVLTMAQPGRRGDPAHRLGYDLSTTILAPWPATAGDLWGGTEADLDKTRFTGPVSRFPVLERAGRAERPPGRSVVVLSGTGGSAIGATEVAAARATTPDWDWVHLDRSHGRWLPDPSALLADAAVVVTHGGQNAVAEIAALRRPALVIPQRRPFDEQQVMAQALVRAGLPVRVVASWPEPDRWPGLLSEVAALDGSGWSRWNDGGGPGRVAAVLAGFDREFGPVPVPA